MNTFIEPSIDWWALSPQLTLVSGALAILLVSRLPRPQPPDWVATVISVITSAITLAFAFRLWSDFRSDGAKLIVSEALAIDGFSILLTALVGAVTLVSALLLDGFARRNGLQLPELQALVLAASVGVIVMAQANDLIVIFLGLETLSLGLYVMAAMDLRRGESQEAAVKYFILGAFSSAFLLYGIALIYGATGSTRLSAIETFVEGNILEENGLLLIGIGLLILGFGFKVAAVPFHMWAPDVYQGAPTGAAGFMNSVAKVGGFAAMTRVLADVFGSYRDDWRPLILVLAVLSLLFGAVLAVVQTDVKRMLAFSSINHAGFMLLAVHAGTRGGVSAVVFYLVTYVFLVLGSFGTLAAISGPLDRSTTLDDLKGLSRRHPIPAGLLTLFLLSQAGVPFTSGFMAKFFALRSAVQVEHWWLAGFAMLTAVIAAFFYLRVIVSMWLQDPDPDTDVGGTSLSLASAVGLGICVVATLLFGLLPQELFDLARDAQFVDIAGLFGG